VKKIVLIILILVAVAVAGFFVWKFSDHSGAFREALYSGKLDRVEFWLKVQPALANARHMEPLPGERDPTRGRAEDWTPLHVAADLGDADLINLLLKYHADVNARDGRGLTPLLWTAFGGKHAAAGALIAGGADVNARDKDGKTTLDLAKHSLDNDLVTLLREHGARE
jgi:26S proteasome non-ATPase regulatory subunit 10